MGIAEDFKKAFLKQHPEADEGKLTSDELNNLLKQFEHEGNDILEEDFDGLGPQEVLSLLEFPLSNRSLLSINYNCPDAVINQCPLFALSELLLQTIIEKGKVKLTTKGNLPVAICELLYGSQDLYFSYKLFVKKIVEDDIPYLWVVKEYLIKEGLVKKRNNILTVTRNGEKYLLTRTVDRFERLLFFYTLRLNWANFFFNDEDVSGKQGWTYSLYLFRKYGNELRSSDFYSEKLIKAFSYEPTQSELHFKHAYDTRFFNCFCEWFGFAEIINESDHSIFRDKIKVKKSDLLDQIFS